MGLYIVLIGIQGAGKGTQAKILSHRYGIPHISTGDLFRAMKKLDTPLAREVQDIMNKGQLIGDELTNRIVADRLHQPDTANGIILDGYPRTIPQAEALDAMLAERGETLTIIPVLELEREIAFRRLEGRRSSQDGERIYNIYLNPPKNKNAAGEWVDDVDGQTLKHREDDMPTGVNKRLDDYYQITLPLLDFYKARGLSVVINADQPIETVTQELFTAIDSAVAARQS